MGIIYKEKSKSTIDVIGKAIILFFFVFEIVTADTSNMFSSRKIIFVCLIIYYLLNKKNYKLPNNYRSSFLIILTINCLITIWLFILYFGWPNIDNASYLLPKELYFVMFTIIGSIVIANIFQSAEEFMKAFIIAILIQSTLIFGQFIFEGFRTFLNDTFQPVGNISYLRTDRASGLGASGANLSVLLSVGILFNSYFVFVKGKNNLKIVYVQIYILLSCLLVARTGFYIAISSTILVLLYLLIVRLDKVLLRIVPAIAIAIFSLLLFVSNSRIEHERLEHVTGWAASAIKDGMEESSVVNFLNMGIPSLSNEIFLGTGIVRGTTPIGTVIQHDGGYIQTYTSLGLIFSFVFYASLFYFLISLIKSIKNKRSKLFLFVFLIIICMVEIKEPFIHRYIMPFILITTILLLRKDEDNALNEKNGDKKDLNYFLERNV